MEIDKSVFFNACQVNFDFLINEHGFSKGEESVESRIYYYNFTNSLMRIKLYYNSVTYRFDIVLIRLIDGLVPKSSLLEPREGFDYLSNAFDLQWVLRVRCPEAISEIEPPRPPYTQEDKEALKEDNRKSGIEMPDEMINKFRKNPPITPEDLEHRVERASHYLKTYASDILQGDFSLFPQLKEIREARRREIAEEDKQIKERHAQAKAEKEANGG